MALRAVALLPLLYLGADATAAELEASNWDAETEGKDVLIKFHVKQCKGCKKLQTVWDQLMVDFEESPHVLVANVTCTDEGAGEDFCKTHGVEAYPAIKYGAPGDLQDYKGDRTYEDLKTFANTNLGPKCTPKKLDLCTPEVRAKMEEYMTFSAERLEGKIRSVKKAFEEKVPLMKRVRGMKKHTAATR